MSHMNYTRTESEEAARSPSPETLTPTEHNPICIIPARMGSKRVYQKNLQEIESNVTLIEQAVECCGCYDFAISTDNPDLVPGSLRSHCITRPAELCTDTADISEAIAHSLKMLASNSDGSRYNTVVVLQPAVVARCPGHSRPAPGRPGSQGPGRFHARSGRPTGVRRCYSSRHRHPRLAIVCCLHRPAEPAQGVLAAS